VQGVRFAIGMPNERAISANEFFLGLKPQLRLDIRVGLATPDLLSATPLLNERYERGRAEHYERQFVEFEPAPGENGLTWRAAAICERLNGTLHTYGLHMAENLLLISSPRTFHGIPYTLHCGFFVRRNATIARADMRTVARSAARLWRRPLFVYTGVNRALPELPGWSVPNMVRPSTMLVQLRDFQAQKSPLQWHRYQAIDFDFA
jgi:hypothetical protein